MPARAARRPRPSSTTSGRSWHPDGHRPTTTAAIRGAAQGFIAFVTLGVGMFIGSYLSGLVANSYRIAGAVEGAIPHDWTNLWLVPAAMAGGVLLLFAVAFNERQAVTGAK